MFELYDNKNKIDDKTAREIYEIMVNNIFHRKENVEAGKKLKDIADEEKYNMWLNMLRTEKDYYTLVYEFKNNPVGFVSYIYIDKELCLAEVQIKEEYQGKYDILRKMLKQILETCDKTKSQNICGTISNNSRSVSVFTHIGMINIYKNWYEISYDELLKWIKKEV